MPSGSLSSLPRAFTSLLSRVCGPKARHQCYLDLQRPRGERSQCHHLLSPCSHPNRVAQGNPAMSPSPHRAGLMVPH